VTGHHRAVDEPRYPLALDAVRLVGLLAEPARRAVVAALILQDDDLDGIRRRTALGTREVVDALDRLVGADLVEQAADGTYVVLAEAFAVAARAAAPAKVPTAHPDAPIDRRRVLDRCFRDGVLVQIPTKHRDRLVVLDELAQRFEPGRRYPEARVNGILGVVHPDTAALRRYLVDDGFLAREAGEYWRAGGTVAY
jgi:hypothetical protein